MHSGRIILLLGYFLKEEDQMYDNFYDDDKELDISAEPKPYSCDELPVDIGSWVSYMPYNDFDQRQLQLDSLLSLPIYNSYGSINFVLSKHIDLLEQYLQNISNQIKITNTETVLETEVFYTSKIEGAKTTRKRTQELHNGSPIQDNNRFSESMVLNNFKAVKMLNLYENRLNEDILYRIWKTLTDGCCQNEEEDVSMDYLLREISPAKEEPGYSFTEDVAFWIGFIYRHLYFKTGLSSADLKEKIKSDRKICD